MVINMLDQEIREFIKDTLITIVKHKQKNNIKEYKNFKVVTGKVLYNINEKSGDKK